MMICFAFSPRNSTMVAYWKKGGKLSTQTVHIWFNKIYFICKNRCFSFIRKTNIVLGLSHSNISLVPDVALHQYRNAFYRALLINKCVIALQSISGISEECNGKVYSLTKYISTKKSLYDYRRIYAIVVGLNLLMVQTYIVLYDLQWSQKCSNSIHFQ